MRPLMQTLGRRGLLVAALIAPPVALIPFLSSAFDTNAQSYGQAGAANAQAPRQRERAVRVEVVSPLTGGMPRTTSQPGTVHAFEWAELFAKESGYLAKQTKDIGDTVKKNEIIAELSAPELDEDVVRCEAAVKRAEAVVEQMKARITSAKAAKKAAEAAEVASHAEVKRTQASSDFYGKQFRRFQQLFASRSIDEKVVDEKEDAYLAAEAALEAAKANVLTAQAKVAEADANIIQAESDLATAVADVGVAESNLAKAKVLLDYTKIRAPFDGVVTHRGFHVGDFIRTRAEAAQVPLFTVARNDLMRIVIEVPDRDVPYVDPGDTVLLNIDALPGRPFEGKIARLSFSEDAHSRTMRVEVDLPNTEGLLRHGMYGLANVVLQPGRTDAVRIPSACLVGESKAGDATVYVVRDGRAVARDVKIGEDNGQTVEVLAGLAPSDRVIANNNAAVHDGLPVEAVQKSTDRRDVAGH